MGPELPAAAAGTSVDLLHVPGFFFGTSGVFAMPMRGVEGLLTSVHDLTGAPWWASIVLATVGVRLAVFPLTVMQQRSMARMQAVKPQMDELTAKMKAASSRGEKGLQDTQRYQKLLHELMQKHNVSPMRTMASAAVQIPLWMTFFFTLRGILARPNDGLGFDTGGTLWFPDLTAHDPYFVLPITCGATFYMMSSIDPAGGAAADGTSTQMRTGMKVVAVAMVPVTAWFESGVFVYWTASNLMTLSQTALLRIPAARAAIGMPPLPLLPAATAAARPAEPVIPKLTYATAPKRAGSVAPAAAASPLATELVIESGVQLPAGAGGKAGKGRGPDRGRKKGRR